MQLYKIPIKRKLTNMTKADQGAGKTRVQRNMRNLWGQLEMFCIAFRVVSTVYTPVNTHWFVYLR